MFKTNSGSSQGSQGSTITQQNCILSPQQVVSPLNPTLMAPQPCQQQNIPASHPFPTVTNADISDLLGNSPSSLLSQAFDASGLNPPMSSQHSFTQLQNIPSLTRGDTIPALSNLSPSLQQYLIADQPDGPQAMDVTSSQNQQSPPVNTSPTASENQVTSSMDKSINGWLESIGFAKYSRVFQEKGLHTADCLEEINLEFFNEANIPHNEREAMWKHILAYRNQQDSLKCTPPLQRVRSDASTISNRSQIMNSQGQIVRATRYTLKQTLSFKVKEEDDDDDDES